MLTKKELENMKKIDIINSISEEMKVTKKEADNILSLLIGIIKNGIVNDGIVDIYGFGKIIVEDAAEKTRKYTIGELKGQEYTVPAHKRLKMKFSSKLKEFVKYL